MENWGMGKENKSSFFSKLQALFEISYFFGGYGKLVKKLGHAMKPISNINSVSSKK